MIFLAVQCHLVAFRSRVLCALILYYRYTNCNKITTAMQQICMLKKTHSSKVVVSTQDRWVCNDKAAHVRCLFTKKKTVNIVVLNFKGNGIQVTKTFCGKMQIDLVSFSINRHNWSMLLHNFHLHSYKLYVPIYKKRKQPEIKKNDFFFLNYELFYNTIIIEFCHWPDKSILNWNN